MMSARLCRVEEGEGAGDVWGLQLELFVLKEWLVSGCEEGIARHVAQGKSAENLKSYTGAVKGIVSVAGITNGQAGVERHGKYIHLKQASEMTKLSKNFFKRSAPMDASAKKK